MGLIKWKDNFSVKVSEVDNQHKKLIGLINQLYDAMRVGKCASSAGVPLIPVVKHL